jgi:hypothetical protein
MLPRYQAYALIAIFGALFDALVLLRKRFLPGMMAHAWQDAFSASPFIS